MAELSSQRARVYAVKGITELFGLIFLLILGIGTPRGTPEPISVDDFTQMLHQDRILATSGRPLELWTDSRTGQLYLRGTYTDSPGLGGRQNASHYFQAPLSAETKAETMTGIKKAGLEVITVPDTKPMNPVVRRDIMLAFLGATVVGYFVTLCRVLKISPSA
jgi:hypothetical protein